MTASAMLPLAAFAIVSSRRIVEGVRFNGDPARRSGSVVVVEAPDLQRIPERGPVDLTIEKAFVASSRRSSQ